MSRIQAFARASLFGLAAVFALHCGHGGGDQPSGDGVQDNKPGDLVITSPARAAFLERPSGVGADAPVTVTGTGATPALTIDGAPATVAADGSFKATVKPTIGLNVIVAVDGDNRLETPFLYGHFRGAQEPVSQAVALDLNAAAIAGGGSDKTMASVTSIVNDAVSQKDLLQALRGQTFKGSAPLGGSWSYKVTGGKYAGVTIALDPLLGNVRASADVDNLEIDGTLTVTYLGHDFGGPVKMTADKAVVSGNVGLAVTGSNGTMKGSMPTAEVTLQGFHYDSNNAGFPCCVDSAMTDYLKPKVTDAVKSAVQQHLPDALAFTLSGLHVPSSLDLSGAGVTKPVPLSAQFDGVELDADGATISAQLLFGATFDPGSPGAKAPGALALDVLSTGTGARTSPAGISVSFDAINQLFFAMWGSGGLARSLPDTAPLTDITIDPQLPPLLMPTADGGVQVALGELVVNAKLSGNAFTAAASITQEITPSSDATTLVLKPKGDPTLSVTWLKADSFPDSTRSLIIAAAKDNMGKILKPVSIPIPTIGLDALGSTFTGKSLALTSPTLTVDHDAARVGLQGQMSVVTASQTK